MKYLRDRVDFFWHFVGINDISSWELPSVILTLNAFWIAAQVSLAIDLQLAGANIIQVPAAPKHMCVLKVLFLTAHHLVLCCDS